MQNAKEQIQELKAVLEEMLHAYRDRIKYPSHEPFDYESGVVRRAEELLSDRGTGADLDRLKIGP